MEKSIKKSDCGGCEDSFYNCKENSDTGKCWRFNDAKLIKRKKVPLSQAPPWKQKSSLLPDCYRQKGYVFINGYREY